MKSIYIIALLIPCFISCKQEKREPINIPAIETKKIDTVSSIAKNKDTINPSLKQTIPAIKPKVAITPKKENNPKPPVVKPVKPTPTMNNKNDTTMQEGKNKPVKKLPTQTNKNNTQGN